MCKSVGQVSNSMCVSVYLAVEAGTWWNDKSHICDWLKLPELVLHSPQGDEMVLVCVPIPGKEIIKSADYKPSPLPLPYSHHEEICTL